MSLPQIILILLAICVGVVIGLAFRRKPAAEVPDDIDEEPEITVESAEDDYYIDSLAEATSAAQIYIWLCDVEEDMDKQLMAKIDQNRFNSLKRMSLRIAHIHMKDKYEELFPKNGAEEEE